MTDKQFKIFLDFDGTITSNVVGEEILRAVADIGTHWMDTVSFVLNADITAVLAELGTWHKTRRRPLGELQTFSKARAAQRYAAYPVKTEDFASVLLGFDNGARGYLAISQVAAGLKNCIRVEIYGSKKSASWCSENPEVLCFGNRDSTNEVAVRGTPAFGPDTAPYLDYPSGHVEGFPDTFKMLFRSVYSAIAGSSTRRSRWIGWDVAAAPGVGINGVKCATCGTSETGQSRGEPIPHVAPFSPVARGLLHFD